MIPLWMTVLAFLFAAYITSSRTYAVLALSAIVNIYLDNFTRADDQYLMVTYSAIEFFTCFAVLHFGDIHKLYQSVILFIMLSLHFTMEAALVFDYAVFIESGIYTYTMTGLIVAQLMGASRGTDKLSWPYSDWRETNLFGLIHHQTDNTAKNG